MTDYDILEQPLPFQISILGTVAEVGQMTTSQQDVPMRVFQLVDRRGRGVACMAYGRHAENAQITEGAEIILYFQWRLAADVQTKTGTCGSMIQVM